MGKHVTHIIDIILCFCCLLCSVRRCRSAALHHHDAFIQQQVCNGRIDLCYLRFDQVTLLGSHNSGSYGYGRAVKCLYGNHNVGEISQLDRGTRLLDIDVCLRDGVVRTCHGRGAIARILRPLEAALQDVAGWVKAHPQEVVMLSFGDNDPADEVSKAKQAQLIAELVDTYFAKPGLAFNTHELHQNNEGEQVWPTLGDMVSSGRRVVVAFEGDSKKPQNDLYMDSPSFSHAFILNLATAFHYTYSKVNNTADYRTLLTYLKYYCSTGMDTAVHFDIFLKPFRLRQDANLSDKEVFLAAERSDACFCNECTAEKLNEAVTRPRGAEQKSVLERAYESCSRHNVRVHAVKIDFEEYGDVVGIISRLNDANVRRYCPSCTLHGDSFRAPHQSATINTAILPLALLLGAYYLIFV